MHKSIVFIQFNRICEWLLAMVVIPSSPVEFICHSIRLLVLLCILESL